MNEAVTFRDVIAEGGSLKRQSESDVVVNFWHIPGGYNVQDATAVNAYFSCPEDAKRFADKHADGPSRSVMQPNGT